MAALRQADRIMSELAELSSTIDEDNSDRRPRAKQFEDREFDGWRGTRCTEHPANVCAEPIARLFGCGVEIVFADDGTWSPLTPDRGAESDPDLGLFRHWTDARKDLRAYEAARKARWFLQVRFRGEPARVEAAGWCFDVVKEAIDRALPASTDIDESSFMVGMAEKIRDRIEEMLATPATENSGSRALAISTALEAQNSLDAGSRRGGLSTRTIGSTSASSRSAGAAAGNAVHIGRAVRGGGTGGKRIR